MAILPINISGITETWLDITEQVLLLELIEEETVEIFNNGGSLIEVIIDTIGTAVIDSSFENKGRIIINSNFLAFPYTNETKFYVRQIKYAARNATQIQIRKPVLNANVGGSVSIHDALIQKYFTYDEDGQLIEEIIINTKNNTATVKRLTYNEDGTLNSCIITDYPLINCADSIGGVDGTQWLLDNTLAIQCTLCKE